MKRAMTRFQPRGFLWDMDGLLVDSEPLWFRVERDFVAMRGHEFTHAMAEQCVGRGMAATLQTMHELFGFDVDFKRDSGWIVDTFVERVALEGEVELKPGAMESLTKVKRLALPNALASSSSRRLIDAVVSRFNLADFFQAIVSGEDVAHHKPAPDVFLRAASLIERPASECVVLEDSLAGATAGRAAGAFVIAIPERDDGRFAGVADVILPSLRELDSALSW
jgi:sugar-phosphatase